MGLLLAELERGDARAAAAMAALKPCVSGIAVIGVTGLPGAGKSTLVNALAVHLGHGGTCRVGIIAVDPSSPVSGGAILGDRLRMTRATENDAVFVRSLSASGHIGGLTPAAARLIDGFDALGFGLVILETVGTGQNEIDVAEVADLRLVVAAPGLGDEIQAMKSGLLEIADIIAVNKSDRPGSEETRQHLAGAASLRAAEAPKVLSVSAMTGDGIEDLVHALEARLAALTATSADERRQRRARYLLAQTAGRVIQAAMSDPTLKDKIAELAEALIDGRRSAHETVLELIERRTPDEQS